MSAFRKVKISQAPSMSFILKAVLLISAMKPEYSKGQSDIYIPGASGSKIVKDAVKKVESSLGTTNKLLERTAYVESKYGKDPNTYRDGYHGGIWQVDRIGFKDTQNVASHPKLKKHFEKIKTDFGIDWSTVKYEDLRKPLYSAIAARLKYKNIKTTIPPSWQLTSQAEYWKKYYNTRSGKGSALKFKTDISTADKLYRPRKLYRKPSCERGSKLFKNLAAVCHSFGAHGTGPNLHGVCGRPAGQSEGYSYSNAMTSSGITWNEKTLERYLRNPSDMIPGNSMAFAGIPNKRDRDDLVHYLCNCNH